MVECYFPTQLGTIRWVTCNSEGGNEWPDDHETGGGSSGK